ncbi:MAG: hypothetical protein HY825_15805 [Acidobacteria bacterium]|nr:hypothetical protein [Acidobacteriota bacterium]
MKKLVLPLVVVALLAASWASATYVIVLKNGRRVVGREKYVVKGNSAVIQLKNGALTSLPLSQIDLPKTELVNSEKLGDAVSLDWVDMQEVQPTPTPTPSVAGLGKIRSQVGRNSGETTKPTPTPGIMFRDSKYSDVQVEKLFQEGLESYHLYLYRTSAGTRPEFMFVEVSVNGQPEVLKALQAIGLTYHLLAQNSPERCPAQVEVQMINESGKEAGLFRLTALEAADLATGKITAEDFFIKKVIF